MRTYTWLSVLQFQNHIYTCLATVLHLGNIKFSQDDSEFSHILEGGSVQTAAVSSSKCPSKFVVLCTYIVASNPAVPAFFRLQAKKSWDGWVRGYLYRWLKAACTFIALFQAFTV